MKISELNQYRRAGCRLRQSPRMQKIRSEIERAVEDMLADESIPKLMPSIVVGRYLQSCSIQQICMRLYISERTYFRNLKRIKAYFENR